MSEYAKGNFIKHRNLKKPMMIGIAENISIINRPIAKSVKKQSMATSKIDTSLLT
jgi:hypothetical protein